MTKQKTYTELFDDPPFIALFTAFKKFMLPFETPMIQTIAEILTPSLQPNIKILEIGFGDGQITNLFLRFLAKTKTITSYSGIEPSSSLYEPGRLNIRQCFEERVIGNFYSNIIAAEQYNRKFFRSFDLIISINSWYGIAYDEILRYTTALNEGGVLAIFISLEDSLTTFLTNQLSDNTEMVNTAEDIEAYLQEQSIGFTAHQIYALLGRENFFMESFESRDKWMIKPEAEGFFRYMLRKQEGEIDSLLANVPVLQDRYFQCWEKLIVIKK